MRVSRLAKQRSAVPVEAGGPKPNGCPFPRVGLSIGAGAGMCASHEGISRERIEVSAPVDLTKVSASRPVAQHPRTVVGTARLFNTKQGQKRISSGYMET